MPRWLLGVLLIASCDAPGVLLAVDLRTDLVPGVEVFRTRTTVLGGEGGEPISTSEVTLAAEVNLEDGARIAEVRGLAAGSHRVVVELLDQRREVVVAREVRVRIERNAVVLVVIARDCVAIDCPGTGDPETHTECLGGTCVPPECVVAGGDEGCVPAECSAATDCPAPVAACATAACVDGLCFASLVGDVCGAGEVCDPDVGCVAMMDGVDAGGPPPDPDADGDGFPQSADCDDGNPGRNPGAGEVCGNGVDENCDGADPPCDNDGDGWPAGADCDDGNPGRNPGLAEVCGNGVDENCDGVDPGCCGGYGGACCGGGGCADSAAEHLACVGGTCLRCCALCNNRVAYHWVNVNSGCAGAAGSYCSVGDRGGLGDAAWGTCDP